MKRSVRKIAVALLVVMLFSTLAGYAYANGITLKEFSVTGQPATYTAAYGPTKKRANNPIVICFYTSSIGGRHNVRVMGCNTTAVNAENCTLYNSSPVDHVVCGEDMYYSIKNNVIEKGYNKVYPSIAQNTGYGTVTGEWAENALQSYNSPSAP